MLEVSGCIGHGGSVARLTACLLALFPPPLLLEALMELALVDQLLLALGRLLVAGSAHLVRVGLGLG